MPPTNTYFAAGFLIFFAAFLSSAVVYSAFPASLQLQRAFPIGGHGELETLKARDRARHGRLLQNVVDFPMEGSADPFTVGLYYARVLLGTPPKEYYVQVDTGSDILWVSCNPCKGCPQNSGLGIALELYDPKYSSTAAMLSCSDPRCDYAIQTSEAACSSESQCSYSFQYGDGSGTSGYYMSDTFYFETVVGDYSTGNSSTSVVFGYTAYLICIYSIGYFQLLQLFYWIYMERIWVLFDLVQLFLNRCSVAQSGDLTKSDRAVDGIFGFGQHDLSIVSQLSSQGIAPKIFSHCLKGSGNGGGVLVLGEILEPGIVYTPLVESQPHYNLNLLSISVNGQTLAIDPSVFATSTNRGTIIDSGTTLAYLAEEAYDPFVNSIIAAVSQSTSSFVSKGNQCFLISESVDEIFPSVTLAFQGASMVLNPQDYLLQQGVAGNALIWCIGWQKIQGQSMTILGDLVLKDKIFVYDLAQQRIGWANFNCSSSVNVSSSPGKDEYFNAGQFRTNGGSSNTAYYWILISINIVVWTLHPFLSFGNLF